MHRAWNGKISNCVKTFLSFIIYQGQGDTSKSEEGLVHDRNHVYLFSVDKKEFVICELASNSKSTRSSIGTQKNFNISSFNGYKYRNHAPNHKSVTIVDLINFYHRVVSLSLLLIISVSLVSGLAKFVFAIRGAFLRSKTPNIGKRTFVQEKRGTNETTCTQCCLCC